MNYTPTILIGVGGLGSSLVNDIYAKLHKDMRNQTVILAMDTDVNWIRSLKNLPENNIIQTSQSQTVGQYIYNKKRVGDNSIEDWFQTDILELQRKLMTDGAGQVRGVSRMALKGAIENNEIKKIIAEISRINTQTSNRFISGVRICMVGSLAGGTGSGIFLQIALMLRKILRDRFGVETVMSIGYFLLGGILEGCGKITGQEELDNINANTYACFKELNALTMNASSANTQELNIQFEYDPYSKTNVLSNKDLPFDYYHIIDHLNLNGKNLGRFEDYISMMANNIYVYLFSPIASGAFSKLDNQILSIVRSMGKNRVSGSAAGRLVYPYEDVLRLFSLKRTALSIGQVWTKFDEMFENDMNEYKRQRQQGDTKTERPILRKKYVFYLENEVNREKANPNFVLMNNQLLLFDENREMIGRKSTELINEIENEIKKRFENDEKLLSIAEDRGKMPRTDKLQIPEAAKGQIQNADRLLRELERAARDFIANNKILSRNILFDDERKNLRDKTYMGEKYYLNYWILNEEPMHPIAARVFIYELINLLEERLLSEKHELEEAQGDYEGLKTKYSGKKGDGGTGTAEDALQKILNQPFYKKVLNGKKDLRFFAEGYVKYFRKRKQAIIDLSAKELQLTIFENLLTWLKLQASIIEDFFFSLDRILDRYDLEERELTLKYEYTGGYDLNVLARPEILDLLWRDKENQLVSFDELPEDLSKTIYSAFYDKFCEKANNENLLIAYSDDFLKRISEDILKNNADYIIKGKLLDLDIIEAIRMEGRLMGKSNEAVELYLEEKLVQLKNLVQAFGPDGNLIDVGRSSFYSMWGINETVNRFIPQALKNDLEMEDSTAASFIVDQLFDKREIIRSKILMGQSLDTFLKFYQGDEDKEPGSYYASYQKRIAELQDPTMQSVTPHLDKRWHLPNYLPEIFPSLNEKLKIGVADTLLKGLITHNIAIKNVGGILVWTANHEPLKDSEGNKINSLNINDLFDALLQNPQLQQKIKQLYKSQFKEDCLRCKKNFNDFILLTKAEKIYYPVLTEESCLLLDILLNFFQTETYKSASQADGILLLKRFRHLLEEMITTTNPNDDPSIQHQYYLDLLENRFTKPSKLYQNLLEADILTAAVRDVLLKK